MRTKFRNAALAVMAVVMIGAGTAGTASAATAAAPADPIASATTTVSVHAVEFNPSTGATMATKDSTTTLAPGVKVTAGSMSAVTPVVVGSAKALTAATGCCSASGGWNVSFQVTNGPSWAPNFIFHSQIIFCWGGGVAGVHWGYVFNCANAPGSAVAPYMAAWFSNMAPVEKNPRVQSTNRYFYGYAPMNNSYNSAFYDGTQGGVDVCGGFCYYSHYPSINIAVAANGTYAWNASAG